jgi:hypothetical protein
VNPEHESNASDFVDDNVIDLPGGPYRAVTLRSFDARA